MSDADGTVDFPVEDMFRLIKQTLLKVQTPCMLERYKNLIVSNTDLGNPVEWSAPMPRAIMGKTIEYYQKYFDAERIGTDKRLDEISSFIVDKLQSGAREHAERE